MFNHNRCPNVAWERNVPMRAIYYYTVRDIEEGEELCISYGPKLWFSDADGPGNDIAVIDEADPLPYEVDIFK